MKKGVAKKATKSVKKGTAKGTAKKSGPKIKGEKGRESRALGIEVEQSSTAHVLFTGATLSGSTLRIPAQAYQCRNLPRPPLTTFEYKVEFNNHDYGLVTAIEASPFRRFEGYIEVDIGGIPDDLDVTLEDILKVTVLTKKRVPVGPRTSGEGEVCSMSSDSSAGTAKKRVTQSKKKAKK
jgi:hypothetical protein